LQRRAWILQVDAIAVPDLEDQVPRLRDAILGDDTQSLEFTQRAQGFFVELGTIAGRQSILELRCARR
jgi:hypothetical protein